MWKMHYVHRSDHKMYTGWFICHVKKWLCHSNKYLRLWQSRFVANTDNNGICCNNNHSHQQSCHQYTFLVTVTKSKLTSENCHFDKVIFLRDGAVAFRMDGSINGARRRWLCYVNKTFVNIASANHNCCGDNSIVTTTIGIVTTTVQIVTNDIVTTIVLVYWGCINKSFVGNSHLRGYKTSNLKCTVFKRWVLPVFAPVTIAVSPWSFRTEVQRPNLLRKYHRKASILTMIVRNHIFRTVTISPRTDNNVKVSISYTKFSLQFG